MADHEHDFSTVEAENEEIIWMSCAQCGQRADEPVVKPPKAAKKTKDAA